MEVWLAKGKFLSHWPPPGSTRSTCPVQPDPGQTFHGRRDLRRMSRLQRCPARAAGAKREQKLRRSVTSQERDSFPGALDSRGLTMKRMATNSIVAFISVIAATSGGSELARSGPMLVFGAGRLAAERGCNARSQPMPIM
jgi:hypothetical protein